MTPKTLAIAWEMNEQEQEAAYLFSAETKALLETQEANAAAEILGASFNGTETEKQAQILRHAYLQGKRELCAELLSTHEEVIATIRERNSQQSQT